MKNARTILLTLLMLLALQLQAAGARRGWVKAELSHADGKTAAVPSALIERFGAELVADYGLYSVVYVPKGIVAALEAQAAKEKFRVRVRDDFDLLELPGGTIDAREGLGNVAPEKLARDYPPGKAGVFVVQFTAPLRAEWMDGMRALGWHFSRYLPVNAYLVVGTPELAGRTKQLPYVQWLDFYHPFQKLSWFARNGQLNEHLFEVVEGAAGEAGVEAIRAAATGEIEVQRLPLDTRVIARMSDAAAEELLRNEVILSVTPNPVGALSDERQVMSLTNNLTTPSATVPLAPTNPGQYWNWVLSRCSECANITASAWRVGIADSGLDNGLASGGHPDLAGRKFFGTGLFAGSTDCTASNPLCDTESHGTIVAGIIAGKGAGGTNKVDAGGFYLGQGVVPTAGILSTKILTRFNGSGPSVSKIYQYSLDAVNGNATIQNHSWNTYSSQPDGGIYSQASRDFDIASRDATYGTVSVNRVPMLFTISAGNNDQGNGLDKHLTLAGATAKNVIGVGGVENYRPGEAPCRGTVAEDFRNIMATSRIGTKSGLYVKPDLMAPASLIVSAKTTSFIPHPTFTRCLDNYNGNTDYTGDSGTSFAAPVAAGASLLVKRYLGSAPQDISPALTKAVLIAGAQTIRKGKDRTPAATSTTITPIPSQKQGFGRLSLDDILNSANKPVVFDQELGSRTFTAAGQSWTTVVRVRDYTKPVKIALVWSDAPGAAGSQLPLVNDLHLEVRRSSNPNVVYVGNSLSVVNDARDEESIAYSLASPLPYDVWNNVEVARLFLNYNEELTITVKAYAIAGDTNGNTANNEQDFALAVLNAQLPCDPVTIVQHPQNVTIQPGQTTTLTVVPGGTGPWDYQWYTGPTGTFGNPVCANTASCTVGPLTQTTQFWVRVRGSCDGTQLYSNAATVTVQCTAAPSITQQPASVTINPGQSTTLSVSATQAVSYQWYQGTSPSTATPVAGATARTLTVTPGATTNYWVRVTNACGFANSATAQVCVRPQITAQPTSRTINPGQSTTLTVTANGATAYQWYVGTASSTATPIGGNSSSLTVAPSATTSYWVRVSNSCSFVDSSTATVTVTPPQQNLARIQSSFALANSQTSITAYWQQPTQTGKLLVAIISGRKDPNGVISWTAPAGWLHVLTHEWTNIQTAMYYIPNAPGGRTSETFTVAQGFHDQTLYLFEYAGVAAVNPIDRIATSGGDTNDGYVQTGYTSLISQPKELALSALTTYTPTEFTPLYGGYTEVYDKFIGNRLTTAAFEKFTNAINYEGHDAWVYQPAQWIGMVVTFRAAN